MKSERAIQRATRTAPSTPGPVVVPLIRPVTQTGEGDNSSGGSVLLRLLPRMRDGDREAAAAFVSHYQARIRRRIRMKLNQPMRRLFDSEEILSTVYRRLDQYVSQGRLQAAAEGQMWSLIFKMADNALTDKARIFRRLQRVEGSDSEVARALLDRMHHAEQASGGGAESEIQRALESLTNPVDRRILLMWLDGMQLKAIAEELEYTATNVRTRWKRLRKHLSRLLREDGLQ